LTKEQFERKARFVLDGLSHLDPEEKSRLIREVASDCRPNPVPDNIVDEVLDILGLPL
jgi:hypothetical protein